MGRHLYMVAVAAVLSGAAICIGWSVYSRGVHPWAHGPAWHQDVDPLSHDLQQVLRHADCGAKKAVMKGGLASRLLLVTSKPRGRLVSLASPSFHRQPPTTAFALAPSCQSAAPLSCCSFSFALGNHCLFPLSLFRQSRERR